jgi:hypothetical protein
MPRSQHARLEPHRDRRPVSGPPVAALTVPAAGDRDGALPAAGTEKRKSPPYLDARRRFRVSRS